MSAKNYMAYGDAETILTEFANKLQIKQIEKSAWDAMSDVEKEAYIAAHPLFQINGGESSFLDTNTFTIESTDWVANTGSDATAFPYVANVSTEVYPDTFIPCESLILGAIPGDYPTAADETAIGLIDKYIKFTGTSIRLRATDAPATDVTLVVRG